MGIHEHQINATDRHLSIDCISGDGTTMELELGELSQDGTVKARIVMRNDGVTESLMELDQERVDRLREFVLGERDVRPGSVKGATRPMRSIDGCGNT